MKIIYISSMCNPKNVSEINKKTIRKLEVSGVKFHNLIMEGFKENEADVISIIGLPISRKISKKSIWKKNIEREKKILYHQVGFINIPILKQLTTAINIMLAYCKYAKKNENVYVIVDASYVSVLPFILFANKFLKHIIVGIVADIYEYMCDVDETSGRKNIFSKFIRKNNNYEKLDGFILLTEQMNEKINKTNKPYIVIEGCSDSNMEHKAKTNLGNKRIVMYSGKLAKKFGINMLVEGFKKIQAKDVELWIYGDGEEKNYVENESKNNSNIKYKGMVPNEEVVEAQTKATLLVNPRPSKEQFTKYSFPSKNIEYMASGTPMVTTDLPGMPDEYRKYVYIIKDETEQGMYETLKYLLELPEDELIQKGKNAKEFILNNKNEKKQSKKIIEFLKEIKKNDR